MYRSRSVALVALALLGYALAATGPGTTRAFGQDTADAEASGPVSVATSSGLVIHGVDRKLAAPRLRQIDGHLARGDLREAGIGLAEILAGPLDGLLEEREGVYLSLSEAALLRVAALPPAGLDAYREYVDPRARAALSEYLERGDVTRLSEDAYRMTLATPGPRLLVLLADAEQARGRLDAATRALEHLLRYLPGTDERPQLDGVDRSAVVSRLAGLLAAQRDGASLRALERELPDAVLALPGHTADTLGQELAAAAELADAGSDVPADSAWLADELTLAGEWSWVSDDSIGRSFRGLDRDLPRSGRELSVEPVPVEGPDGPLLLIKRLRPPVPFGGTQSPSVLALAPPRPGTQPSAAGEAPRLRAAWEWPSPERRRVGSAPDDGFAFRAAVAGDVVLFPWPSAPRPRNASERFPPSETQWLNHLVALSIRREGAEVDVRGPEDPRRPDADPELRRLSFVGRPLVVGDAVYTTLVGRARGGGYTELHVARFDLRPEGSRHRLFLRWRTHVLDGAPHPDARYDLADLEQQIEPALVAPGGLAERRGRLFVATQTGAMVALDGWDGDVSWIETYPRLGSDRLTLVPARLGSWKHHTALVDGYEVHVTPRDSEELLSYRVMPFLDGRSTLTRRLPVRGSGSARRPGTPLAPLLPDEVVTVRAGVAFVSGRVAPLPEGSLRLPTSPLVAYRLREARDGEPAARLRPVQIGEATSAGSPALVPGHLLFPTYKAVYRVSLADPVAEPRRLWTAVFPEHGSRLPDRIGNLVADGPRLWSVTPERVVLLRPAE